MDLPDWHASVRRAWRRTEQQPRVTRQTPQSDFDQSRGHALPQAVRQYEAEAALWRARGIPLSGPLNAAKTLWQIAYRRARLLNQGLVPRGVPLPDANTEARHAWLRTEQQPRVTRQIPQSNFEQSPCSRLAFSIACIVIAIQVFTPDPDVAAESHNPSTVQAGHVRPMV